MKLKNIMPIVAMASVVSMAAISASAPVNAAEMDVVESRFNCSQVDGVPTTMAKTSRGMVPVIRWTSNYFSSSGYSPQSRCRAVSRKFETYHQNGTLNFLTTGTINRLPVICVAEVKGGACRGVLFTLKPGANAGRTLRQLLNVRDRASGPLNETSARVYIDVEKFLKAAPVEKAAAIEPIKTEIVETVDETLSQTTPSQESATSEATDSQSTTASQPPSPKAPETAPKSLW